MASIPHAGISPAAAYGIEGRAEVAPIPAILADDIDPATGDYRSVLRGAPIADAMVIHLLSTQRGSGAAVLAFGQQFREVRHVSVESAERIRQLVEDALQPAKDAGIAELVELTTEGNARDRTMLVTGIVFRDLRAPARSADRSLTFEELGF